MWWGIGPAPFPLFLPPHRFSLYVGSLGPTLQRPEELGRVMAPKLPAQKLPSSGCGAGEGAGLLLRWRPGWHHQEAGPGNSEAGINEGSPRAAPAAPHSRLLVGDPSRLSGQGPPEWEGDSPVPRGPLGCKGQQCWWPAPSLVSLWSPHGPSPTRKPVVTSRLTGEEVEAQGG